MADIPLPALAPATGSSGLPAELEEMKNRLAVATSWNEIASIRNRARAVEMLTRNLRECRDLHLKASEIMVRSLRHQGEAVAQLDLHRGAPRQETADVPRLAELGLTANDVSKSRRIWNVPAEAFETWLEESKLAGRISIGGVLRLARAFSPSPHYGARPAAEHKVERDQILQEFVNGGDKARVAATVLLVREGVTRILPRLGQPGRRELFRRLRDLLDQVEAAEQHNKAHRR